MCRIAGLEIELCEQSSINVDYTKKLNILIILSSNSLSSREHLQVQVGPNIPYENWNSCWVIALWYNKFYYHSTWLIVIVKQGKWLLSNQKWHMFWKKIRMNRVRENFSNAFPTWRKFLFNFFYWEFFLYTEWEPYVIHIMCISLFW